MLQTTPTTSPAQSASFSLAEQLFGDTFEVWTRDYQWHRIKTMGQRWDRLNVDFYIQLIELLNETSRSSRVQFFSFDRDRALCLLPLPAHHADTVALSIVASDPQSILNLAERSASAAVVQQEYGQRVQRKLRESDSQLAAYSTRINQGEGELAWLHSLAGSAALSGTENNPALVAERILPDMAKLINARMVAFVPFPNENEDSAEPLPVWQTGDLCVPEHVILSLIADHGTGSQSEASVCHYNLPEYRTSEFAGVLACIVMPILSRAERVGWILAINKDLRFLASADDTIGDLVHSVRQQHCGFGSFESSLVNAAGNAIAAHARNCRLLAEKEALVDGTIRSLVNAIDAKDSYTCGHSDRVAVYARQIAEAMQLSEQFCDRIYMTGLVHDVGKIGVPDSVLQKPGKLTEEEFDRIKEHPITGHAILEHLQDFSYVLPGVLHHHEAVDGSGYPSGLKGDRIPLQARILAVADAYDAMTSDRPYRDGMPTAKAESIIAEGAGTQWDGQCVAAFQSCIENIRRVAHERHESVVGKPVCRF